MSAPRASFYFDLASPLAYLAAEQVLHALPAAAEWQPVLARELRAPTTKSFLADRESALPGEQQQRFRGEIARRAQELGLQPLRWPEPFPFDSTTAMHVATYAKSIGRVVPFAQAAFRQAFAGGRNLEEIDNVLIAAAACEMHPAAVLSGSGLRSLQKRLTTATAVASALGIETVPAVLVGERVFEGEGAIERASAHMFAAIYGAS